MTNPKTDVTNNEIGVCQANLRISSIEKLEIKLAKRSWHQNVVVGMDLDEAIQRSRGERLAHPRVFNFDPQSQMSDEKNIYE